MASSMYLTFNYKCFYSVKVTSIIKAIEMTSKAIETCRIAQWVPPCIQTGITDVIHSSSDVSPSLTNLKRKNEK